MINRTPITKSTSIVSGSRFNFGLNPICELNYGHNLISRALIYFDVTKLKDKLENKIYPDITKLKHILKLTNCGSVNPDAMSEKISSSDLNGIKERAASFSVILFLLPQDWDEGRGFDYGIDFWYNGKPSVSTHGCNWYQSQDGKLWPEEGIYNSSSLRDEVDKFLQNQESIVISIQHFDFGNENFEFDITDIVNKFIQNEMNNYGIGIAFSPELEDSSTDLTQYVGFFNEKTNTFFKPFLETIYDDHINDDRANFILNKQNRLYLYSNIGGNLENLDTLPICTINDKEYEVKQGGKGIYYAEILIKDSDVSADTILYDNWSNIVYNGTNLDDIEMEFVTHAPNNFFNIGYGLGENEVFVPFITGINDNEDIISGQKLLINVDFKKQYQANKRLLTNCEYRIFVKDAKREIEIIPFNPIEKTFLRNFFTIDTNEFLPNTYYVDIRVTYGGQTKLYKEKLRFNIINDVTNIKH